jgi:hypothetical protein
MKPMVVARLFGASDFLLQVPYHILRIVDFQWLHGRRVSNQLCIRNYIMPHVIVAAMKTLKIQPRLQVVPPEQVPHESVYALYQRVFYEGFFEQLSHKLGIKTGKMIFNWMAIIYGMILQRLSGKGTLCELVADLIPVLGNISDHKRVKENTVSTNPGGFCRARGRVPMRVVEESFDHLFESLHAEEDSARDGSATFLLDGSGLTLEPTPELLKAYPPARNQHGASHWPIMRVVVAHNVKTGLASRPAYGPARISEQALADELIARLPARSTIVGDRNFGIFATAYRAVNTGHPVILRLTEVRAKRFAGLGLNCGTDHRVIWGASTSDRKTHPDLQPGAQISGRLIVWRIEQAGKPAKLYLFTTSEDSAENVVKLYGERWNIETDLRSLKRTVRLHSLNSRTPDMVAKELVLGVAAYNLVHILMKAAAQRAGLNPRELSFSWAQDQVYAALPALLNATSAQQIEDQLDPLLRRIASCKLPKRRKRRSYPRKIWMRRRSFPTYPTRRT